MNAGNISGKGKSISHAISIVDNGLRASLDKKVGGSIASSLDALYQYISHRLLIANLNNDADILHEVHALLLDLKMTWDAIAPTADVTPIGPAAIANMGTAPSTYAPTLMKA